MTAILRVYDSVTIERPNRTQQIDDLKTPKSETTIDFDAFIRKDVSLDPGESKLVWNYTEAQDFQLLRLWPTSDYLYVSWVVDQPTDAANNDLTPSGNAEACHHAQIAGLAPFYLDTDECLTHATLASVPALETVAGQPVKRPTLFADANKLAGKIYGVWVYNPQTTGAIVRVEVIN